MILFAPELDPKNLAAAARPTGAQRIPTARTLQKFLDEAQAAVKLKGQVTVMLMDDAEIRRLNRQYRGKNKATDVLSFPAMPMPGLKASEQLAGDLAISLPTATKQAADQGHPLATELKVLVLHGLLHLAGLDHEADEGQMARREQLLRKKLGLPAGLIERVETPAAKPAAKKAAKKTAAKSPAKKAAPKPAKKPAKPAAAAPAKAPRKKAARSSK